jgi:hypothetical protein
LAKTPPNHHKHWTPANNRQLRALVRQDTPTGLIAYKLGRSKGAIYNHASAIGLSLEPTNRSPYNRHRK